MTTVITAERDQPDRLTRHGIEEFVSDCVILLDHRIREEISTRRLRIVKYRGSTHGTNEYPFLIDDQGISVLPISSLGLNHDAPAERVSSGIARLDGMLGGKGFYRGSSILASGTAGTGKTTIAACFVDAACRRGDRALFFAFEESPQQIVRNMRSIGIDLEPWVRKGLLQFHAARPTYGGIEQVLLLTHKRITSFRPSVVVVDPVTNLLMVSTQNEVRSMLTRLVDFLKTQEITTIFTSLTAAGSLEAITRARGGAGSRPDGAEPASGLILLQKRRAIKNGPGALDGDYQDHNAHAACETRPAGKGGSAALCGGADSEVVPRLRKPQSSL